MESQPPCRKRCRMHRLPWRNHRNRLRRQARVRHLRILPHRSGGPAQNRPVSARQNLCELPSGTHLRPAQETRPGSQVEAAFRPRIRHPGGAQRTRASSSTPSSASAHGPRPSAPPIRPRSNHPRQVIGRYRKHLFTAIARKISCATAPDTAPRPNAIPQARKVHWRLGMNPDASLPRRHVCGDLSQTSKLTMSGRFRQANEGQSDE